MYAREERNQDATVFVGELDSRVTEALLWELMLQSGPVVNVYIPKDKLTNLHQGYGFVEFATEEDAEYAIKIMNMIKLYGKPLRVNKAKRDGKTVDVGANLFVGNLDAEVDEKLLYDTFSAFGVIITTPKIMRDPETGESRGFGFVSFDSFESSDAAIESMNGQYLCNRAITVSYAIKKDSKTGERHGSAVERQLAANNPARFVTQTRPNTMFAAPAGGGMGPMGGMGGGMGPMGGFMPPPPQFAPQFPGGFGRGAPMGYPPMGGPPRAFPPPFPPQGFAPQGFPPQGFPPQGFPMGAPPSFPPQGAPPSFPPQGPPPQQAQ
jgi:splicing factor 3B subunit 4